MKRIVSLLLIVMLYGVAYTATPSVDYKYKDTDVIKEYITDVIHFSTGAFKGTKPKIPKELKKISITSAYIYNSKNSHESDKVLVICRISAENNDLFEEIVKNYVYIAVISSSQVNEETYKDYEEIKEDISNLEYLPTPTIIKGK